MKSLIKKSALVLLAAPLAFGSVSALAAGMGGHGDKAPMHGKCGMGMERGIWKKLDLTDAQKTQLKELRQKDREAMKTGFKANMQEMRIDRQEMQKLVMADNFDQAAVQKLAQKMADQRVEGQVKMEKSRHDMFSVLTPEQKQEFVKLQGEKHQQCMEKWEHMKDRMDKKAADSDVMPK
ncbi:CpxP family protein [Vibrio aphrogenes]|uniref:CpxP family protein n=1 Tax=Vibrio aphrogenes TaxID=1891186 RepID=UPI000B35BFE2|nr:CpxP family protein [Vibrio aphrogenes]